MSPARGRQRQARGGHRPSHVAVTAAALQRGAEAAEFLRGHVTVWQACGQGASLDRYLQAAGARPASRTLPQFKEFHGVVRKAVVLLCAQPPPPALPPGPEPVVVPAASADAVTSGTFMLAGHWHQDPDTDTEWRTLVPVDPAAPGQLNGKVEALGEAAEADPPFGPLDENTEGHMIVFQTEHDKHDKEEAARRGKAAQRRKAAATTHTEDKEQGEAAPEEPQRHEPRPDSETPPDIQDASPPDGAA